MRWYCSASFLEEIQGDLHEWYSLRVERQGVAKARLLYIIDVIRFIRTFRIKKIHEVNPKSNLPMYKNYFTIAVRNAFRHKFFSSINVIGLAVGIAASLLLATFVLYEVSYDKYHEKLDDIYMVLRHNPEADAVAENFSYPVQTSLVNEYPGITVTSFGNDPVQITYGDKSFYEPSFFWADSTLFDVFSYEVLQGNPETALAGFNSLVITKSMAEKYFGSEQALGKIVEIKIFDGNKTMDFEITAVIADVPENSHLRFKFLGSMNTAMRDIYPFFSNHWSLNWLFTYALVPSEAEAKAMEANSGEFFEKYRREGASRNNAFIMKPLKDVYLKPEADNSRLAHGNINQVYALSTIAFLILIIACINYMNLATARSAIRGKEVGVRKSLGAAKSELFKQFLGESILVALGAVLLGTLMAYLFLPVFTDLVGKELSFEQLIESNGIGIALIFTIGMGIASGIYPATLFSNFRPALIIRNSSKGSRRNLLVRRTLVTLQLGISVFLIFGSVVIYSQIEFFQNASLGFNKDQLISIPVEDRDLQTQIVSLRNEMEKISGVEAITISGESLPSAMNNTWDIGWQGLDEEEDRAAHIVSIGYNFFDALDIPILYGRGFSPEFSTDSSNVVINEAAMKLIGGEEVVGKTITIGGNEVQVLGVAQNHNYSSLRDNVDPIAYVMARPGNRISNDNVIARLSADGIRNSLKSLEDTWDDFSPNKEFVYEFVDENFAQLYKSESRFLSVFGYFTGLAILVAALGLVGLAAFVAEQKTKEIGIRKILGANNSTITVLLTKDFVKLAVIAFVLITPLSFFIMERWLQQFANRINIGFGIIAVTILSVVLLTWFTVMLQSLKAVFSNPAETLRSE